MRNALLIVATCLTACTGAGLVSGDPTAASGDRNAAYLNHSIQHGFMRADGATLSAWRDNHGALPKASIDQDVHRYLLAANAAGVATSVNLLPYMSYPQSQRNQGNCGDCWVWGSTATAEILMGIHGVKDALSVQYFNSAYTSDFACCGGDLTTFASWYASKKLFVPLSNTNGGFVDANADCSAGSSTLAASKISTSPNHAFTGLSPGSITTTGVGQATAISNIKNVLNQNQPVAYSYFLPTDPAWNDFFNFWDNQPESALWSPDAYSGQAWNNGGGHLVTIVGYDDSDSNAANHYWVVLNSWGTASNRPNGVFHLAQQINYDSYFTDSGTKYDSNIFETMSITWSGNTALSIATQPASISVAAGQPAIFKVVVSGGTQPYSYQWSKNGSAISGATSASYSISAVAAADQASYSVVVKDSASASVTSQAATLTVTTCTAQCSGKACGSDGCGGSCGTCSGSTSCNSSGQCVGGSCTHPLCSTGTKLTSSCDPCVTKICATDSYCCNNSWDSTCVNEVNSICKQSCSCTPQCSGKTCGSDGCGGTCGTCASGQSCNTSGQCVASCTPNCSGKVCGDDGCGGSCGTCASGQTCSSSGQCTGGGSCTHPICAAGAKLTSGCDPCATNICSSDAYCCNSSWDATCVKEVASICGQSCSTCTPSCSGKTCGSDGCGGTCGTCASGQTCNASGQCASGGSCTHPICSSGAKLTSGCDPCATKICSQDSYCCSNSWDATCVSEVASICGQSC